MTYCTQCGALRQEGAAFCTHCGAKAADIETRGTAGVAPQAASTSTGGSGIGKVLLWGAGILLTLAVVGIVGTVWVVHRVKEKVVDKIHAVAPTSTETKTQNNNDDKGPQNDGGDPDVAKALGAIGGILDRAGFGDPPPNPYSELPVVKSDQINKNLCDPQDEAKEVTEAVRPGSSGIPRIKGLLVVHAWGRKSGDSESMQTVSKITDKYVEVSNTGTFFTSPDAEKGNPGAGVRDVCSEALKTAQGLSTGFGDDYPRVFPGTTTIDVSPAVLTALKTAGAVDFRYVEYYRMQGVPDGEGYLHGVRGSLKQVEPEDVSFPVIVNGVPTNLPAVHAAGTMLVESKKAQELSKSRSDQPLASELYVLDDAANPLLLLFKQNINNFRVQVTEIRFPVSKPENKLEDELQKNKKAVVYGIYFDYNSDQIKKESEPVLQEIAQAMRNNPDWKLTVYGHTDSIGGDAYNLDLSKRRAASVKRALVERFQVDSDRLLTDGFGMRQPVDRNDTLEGRAKNRRVELTRQ